MSAQLKVVTRAESEYFKEFNPYYDTRTRHGRPADTILLFVFRSPTGRWSKYQATLRFHGERNVSSAEKMRRMQEYIGELRTKTFKSEFAKGYTIGEIILYSGTL